MAETVSYPRMEVRKLCDLKSHPDGVREASAESLYRLGKSLATFGLLRPLVLNVRTGWVLDGDHTLAALRAAGTQDVPVWCVDVAEELEDAAHLALNNHCGEWRWQAVSELLKAVVSRQLDPGLTGFHECDTGPLLAADWAPAKAGPLDGSDPQQVGFGF